MTVHRRDFLQSSLATAATVSALTATGAANKPNDRLRVAVMGVRGRGRGIIRGFSRLDNVEIATLCDPDESVIPRAIKEIHEPRQQPKIEKDVRKVLEDPNIDALLISAPDHWHALATIWACQAGKHVYVEKPISHNIAEGQLMVKAARRYKRKVQYGTQRRSGAHFKSAVEFVQSGKLGKIPFARTWIAGNRPSIGHKKNGPVPKGVDYNLWLGPAPQREFNPNHFHYNWHWFWEYGTGEIGNNGIHALDLTRWLLNLDAPKRVSSGGGKYFYDDDRVVPDTQVVTYDFKETCVIWEHRFWSKTGVEGQGWGVILYGEKGTLIFDKAGWHVEDGIEGSDKTSSMEKEHLQNFVDGVRKDTPLNAEIAEGHQSTILCHLGNIAFRTGHTLNFDGKSETIIGDKQANALLKRDYREPFSLPEKI